MAVATLAEIYDNGSLFEGVVKLRKGLAVKMILGCGTMPGLMHYFSSAVTDIASRIPTADPSAARTRAVCLRVLSLIQSRTAALQLATAAAAPLALPLALLYSAIAAAALGALVYRQFVGAVSASEKWSVTVCSTSFALVDAVLLVWLCRSVGKLVRGAVASSSAASSSSSSSSSSSVKSKSV
jgi:hypothetical protein